MTARMRYFPPSRRDPDDQLAVTRETISTVLGNTNAAKTTEGLQVNDVYYSKKIPYAYDYADKDYDVFPYDSDHGTHVGGIIGGSTPNGPRPRTKRVSWAWLWILSWYS